MNASRPIQPLLRAVAGMAMLLCGALAAGEPLQVEVDAENPPFMYVAADQPAGIYPAVIAAAFERIGVAVRIEPRPWKRALLDIDAGRAGVGGIYKNSERLKKYDFSEPIFIERLAVFYNSRQPLPFHSLADLYGKHVGVIRGWSYGDDFDTARKAGLMQVNEAGSDLQSLTKLALKRIDAAIVIVEAAEAIIRNEHLQTIIQADTLLASNPAHLAFAKSARQAELLDRFNRALAEMKKDGTLARLIARELARTRN